MYRLFQIGLHILCLLNAESKAKNNTNVFISKLDSYEDFYRKLISEIKSNNYFDTILIVQKQCCRSSVIDSIYKMDNPRLIMTPGHIIRYKEIFNSQILVVMDLEPNSAAYTLKSLALSLKHMRQSKIFIIAMNFMDPKNFRETFLKLCEDYKMANVIIHFSQQGDIIDMWYYLIRPFPKYHWELVQITSGSSVNFPLYWLNMQNATVLTLPDQIIQNSIAFKDSEGNLKFNGIAARLVLLFAEKYKATLKLSQEVQVDQRIHTVNFINFTKLGLVDVPMSFYVILFGDECIVMSYPLMIGSYMLMLPVPQQMALGEIYSLLLPRDIFVCSAALWIIFSVLHGAIDYIDNGQLNLYHTLMSDKVLPGLLGQTVYMTTSPFQSLKIIYISLFFLGLILNTLFAANFKTLITSPPFYRKFLTFNDISNSNLKIMLELLDFNKHPERIAAFRNNVEFAANSSVFLNKRMSLNQEYGYGVPTAMWNILAIMQSISGHKLFYITPSTRLYDLIFYGVVLEENSLFMEPLNHLIHMVHDTGLMSAWYTSSVLDMMNHKNMTKAGKLSIEGNRILTREDLQWVWILTIGGMTSGLVAFLIEYLIFYWNNIIRFLKRIFTLKRK